MTLNMMLLKPYFLSSYPHFLISNPIFLPFLLLFKANFFYHLLPLAKKALLRKNSAKIDVRISWHMPTIYFIIFSYTLASV